MARSKDREPVEEWPTDPDELKQEVEKATTTGELATIPPAVASMIVELKSWAQERSTEGSPAEISMDILERILTADSLEDASGQTTDLVELLGRPVFADVKSWLQSDLGELGVFAVLEVKDDTGASHIVTCGGRNVVAIFYRAQKEARLPIRGKFRSATTRSGFDTLWFDVLPQ